MKITAELTSSQKRRLFIKALTAFIFVGVIAGTALVVTDSEGAIVTFLKAGVPDGKETFAGIFLNSLITAGVLLLFQMICGFFALGQPFCLITLIYRGASGGVCASMMYLSWGFKGFFAILTILIPVMLANMYILVLGARESVRMSNRLACYTLGRSTQDAVDVRLYFVKFIVLTAFAVGCALIEGVLTCFFGRLFLC